MYTTNKDKKMEKCVHRTHIPPLLPAKVNRGTTLKWKKWSNLKSNLGQTFMVQDQKGLGP